MSDEMSITEGDIKSFAAKLDEWGSTLSEKEQVMLHVLLSSANDSEVEGFAFPSSGGEIQVGGGGGAGKANFGLVVDALSPQLAGPAGWPVSPTGSGGQLMADRPATNADHIR